MKLLVGGEGASELSGEQDGVLAVLVRRVLGDEKREIEIETRRLLRLPSDPDAPKGATGEVPKAAMLLREAARSRCDGAVFVCNGDNEATQRTAHLASVFGAANIAAAFGVAIETLEAWIMADARAVRAVVRGASVVVPAHPEQLWGSKHSAGHPKFEWNELCRRAGYDHGAETQCAIAESSTVATLVQTCPRGFGAFHDRLLRTFPPFDIVVAADRHWGIGRDEGLPWPKLKSDLAHFKSITSTVPEGKRNAVIMGRGTWESREVNRRPLPRRLNVVISRRTLELPDGVVGAKSVTEGLWRAGTFDDVADIFIVGGAQIYREAIAHPRFRYAYLTRVDGDFDCTAKIPDLDATMARDTSWAPAQELFEDAGVSYRIERLGRR